MCVHWKNEIVWNWGICLYLVGLLDLEDNAQPITHDLFLPSLPPPPTPWVWWHMPLIGARPHLFVNHEWQILACKIYQSEMEISSCSFKHATRLRHFSLLTTCRKSQKLRFCCAFSQGTRLRSRCHHDHQHGLPGGILFVLFSPSLLFNSLTNPLHSGV